MERQSTPDIYTSAWGTGLRLITPFLYFKDEKKEAQREWARYRLESI